MVSFSVLYKGPVDLNDQNIIADAVRLQIYASFPFTLYHCDEVCLGYLKVHGAGNSSEAHDCSGISIHINRNHTREREIF